MYKCKIEIIYTKTSYTKFVKIPNYKMGAYKQKFIYEKVYTKIL